MDIRLKKWGNSLGFRVPHRLVESLGWDDTCILELQEQGETLIIRQKPQTLTLDDVLASIPENFQYLDDVQGFLETQATGQELL
ncbi:cell growth regulatory protein [Picosynechococcus sp. NKBG15041c]|uniref:AbrB/MazE/SpoVT family DNA-binding domain-containing protein n=1 Tax=Picosynechococcus sp. NKBG15041c TaxID=1407650 RepID=UPI0003FE9845|nr:cell growth regulatory protein [Picosynechococcus sp. NKBG15041c]